MTVDFDMLRMFMKDMISRHMNGNLIIGVKRNGMRNQYTEIPFEDNAVTLTHRE